MEGADIHYASFRDWEDIMKNRSSLRMHALIQRLGLRAKWSSNKRGKTNFENPSVKALVADMGEIVATLPKDSVELVQHLAAPDSLRPEVEELMSKHGSAIWGRMSLRDHLLSADEQDVDTRVFYPRDLYYEIEEDRTLIQMLLHWWIGLKACNVILARERLDRERRKKEEMRKVIADQDSPREAAPLAFVSLAPNPDLPTASTPDALNGVPLPPGNQASRHAQAFRLDTSSRGSSMSPAVHTPASSESPTMHARSIAKGNGIQYSHRDTAGSSGAPSIREGTSSNQSFSTDANIHYQRSLHVPSQPDSRKLSLELGNLVSNFLLEDGTQERASPITPQFALGETPHAGAVTRSLDIETFLALRAYLYREPNGARLDEDTLLRRLESSWRDGVRAGRNHIVEVTPLFFAMDRTLLTWIEIRRHLADLERADRRWCDEGNSDHEIAARVQQHRTLMSASREMIRNWQDIEQGLNFVNVSAAKLTADDLLLQAFVLLAGENNTADTTWVPVNVEGVIRWLAENVQQFTSEQAAQANLLYVGT